MDSIFSSMIGRFKSGDYADFDNVGNVDLVTLARMLGDLQNELDRVSEIKSNLQKAFDRLRISIIPEAMSTSLGDIRSITIEGLGRLQLTADLHVSVPEGDREKLHRWLISTGHSDLITEVVNGSTLKAFVKRELKQGTELPELMKISPFVRASITKV